MFGDEEALIDEQTTSLHRQENRLVFDKKYSDDIELEEITEKNIRATRKN